MLLESRPEKREEKNLETLFIHKNIHSTDISIVIIFIQIANIIDVVL